MTLRDDNTGESLLTTCCKCKHQNLIRYFLALRTHFGGMRGLSEEVNKTALLSIAVQNELSDDTILRILDARSDPNNHSQARKLRVETPLVYAVAARNERLVKLLLVSKANPNEPKFDMKGSVDSGSSMKFQSFNRNLCCSPVRWAVRAGDANIFLLLVAMKGDVMRISEQLETDSSEDANLNDIVKRVISQERLRLEYD